MNCQKQLHSKEIYALSSIPQNAHNENDISSFVSDFMKDFHVDRLLFKCNAGKEKGIPVMDIMKPLISDDRKDVFIIDDSLYDRSRSRNTELLAKVFDHCFMKFKRGYRMLTLGWSDGNSFVPVSHCLLSVADD